MSARHILSGIVPRNNLGDENADHDLTWCGRLGLRSREWTFLDPTHAALAGRAATPIVACSECIGAIQAALGKLVQP